MLLSGVSSLVLELTWTRMLGLLFGVSVYAVSTVVAAFFLGMAIGGVLGGRMGRRGQSPIRALGWLHLGVALGVLGLLLVYPWLREGWLGVHRWLGAGTLGTKAIGPLIALCVLAVPTTLLGATFPVAVRAAVGDKAHIGRDLGLLYGAGTVGGVVGCLATVFVLLDCCGTRGTILAAAGLAALVGVVAVGIDRWTNIEPEGARPGA
jgi:spermidine synthase